MVITSACHAEGPSSILGNSVKMLTAISESELDQLVDHLAYTQNAQVQILYSSYASCFMLLGQVGYALDL